MDEQTIDRPVASLLLVLPLPVFRKEHKLFIDAQAANGLHQWLQHFSSMTLAVKVIDNQVPPADTVAIDQLGLDQRLNVVILPLAPRPLAFLKALPAMRRLFAKLIEQHDYLQFAIGGAWGDWGAVGALMAAQRGRKASVWTDRVESEVMRLNAGRSRGVRRLVRWVDSRVAFLLERRVIRRSALGLFHGKDTFDTYRSYSPNPHLVHNIHLKPVDRISSDQLLAKVESARANEALDLIYVGRVHPDKGVMDWIETLHIVRKQGVAFRARWYGSGPQLDEACAQVDSLGLSDCVYFPGPVTERPQLLEALRGAHLMLFCHLTPESPRCLIEALVSGTPLVGYSSSYSEDLICGHNGGILTAMDPKALAGELVALAHDRERLAALIPNAARDGYDMNDEAVFAHRSELMKRYC